MKLRTTAWWSVVGLLATAAILMHYKYIIVSEVQQFTGKPRSTPQSLDASQEPAFEKANKHNAGHKSDSGRHTESQDVQRLRARLFIEAATTMSNPQIAESQLDAIHKLGQMRTQETLSVLLDFIHAEKPKYFGYRRIAGVWHYSSSFDVMLELYLVLNNAPAPVNGRFYEQRDLSVWHRWLDQHSNDLVIRRPNKPVPPFTKL